MTCDGTCLWHRKFVALGVDFRNLELDLIVKRRQLAELKSRLDGQEIEKVDAPIVQALFDYWRLLLRDGRKSVKLGEKRRGAIRGRLREGYSAQQLMMAIDGALHDAFEKDGKRYDDVELILRNEVNVERFMAAWLSWNDFRHDHMRVHGFWPDTTDDIDTSDKNLARVEELAKVRTFLREYQQGGTP